MPTSRSFSIFFLDLKPKSIRGLFPVYARVIINYEKQILVLKHRLKMGFVTKKRLNHLTMYLVKVIIKILH